MPIQKKQCKTKIEGTIVIHFSNKNFTRHAVLQHDYLPVGWCYNNMFNNGMQFIDPGKQNSVYFSKEMNCVVTTAWYTIKLVYDKT